MFWRKPAPPGIVVDPQKEAQRLRENAALGQSQETGDTPIIQPQEAGTCWKASSSGIGTGLDAPHFIQVGDARRSSARAAATWYADAAQSMLIKGYLPANFLAIRIKCFRCGAVTETPGLPEGEILAALGRHHRGETNAGGRAAQRRARCRARLPGRNERAAMR